MSRLVSPALTRLALSCAFGFGAATVLVGGCDDTALNTATDIAGSRASSDPTEWTGLSTRLEAEGDELLGLLDGLVGAAAADGDLDTIELGAGLRLSASEDSRTPEQVVLTVEMDTSTGNSPETRTLARVPASFAYGSVFIDTVEAALASAQTEQDPEDWEPYRLEYRLRSDAGGWITLAIVDEGGEAGSAPALEVTVRTPRTSLLSGEVNSPAGAGEPWESLYGLVNFTMSRDHFDFFSTRAYGLSAGAAQNFEDFLLLPHPWLRLTVTPELDDELVDVAFEVVTVDGRRLSLARAPASLVAGDQFREDVYRMIDNMLAAEEEAPGSSVPFSVPFYYDDPAGGGVVEVIAEGEGGVFRVAYAVESPVNVLLDTDFVAYQGVVEVPEDWDQVDPSCEELGSEPSAQGYFDITFAASSTVQNSDNLDGPLQGPVWGSIFRADEVQIDGPIDGAEAVASFAFEDVDISGEGDGPYRVDTPVLAGEYQVLGFMDIDGNADPDDAEPDENDPVMIPIGGFTLECAEHPITAEFAILLP